MSPENIAKQYFNPELPGSFSGLEKFYLELKKRDNKVTKTNIQKWLMSQDTYTHHFPSKKRFKRNKVLVNGIDHVWQADLCDVSNISKHNDGYKYLITCIDVFSKYAWAIPIKNKSAEAVIDGFKKIFSSNKKPIKIQTDEGKEFFNKHFKTFLEEMKIDLYKVNSEMKACVVERFNRTLKEKMYRYFTLNKTNRYLDVIQSLINSYNNTFHNTIKTTPNSVNKVNEFKIWKLIYGLDKNEIISFKFKEGDTVLISKEKNIFSKGYTPRWVREVFIINECIPRYPPVYKIKDRKNREISGVFYEPQLQKVIKENFEIDKVLKSRINNSKKEYFVRWLGYNEDFDEWIDEEEYSRIKNEPIRNIAK